MSSASMIYKFHVQGAGDNYKLILQANSEKEARKRAEEIAGKGRSVALTVKRPGTLEEYCGGEAFEERVRKHWNGAHKARWEVDQIRRKAQKRSTTDNTPW